MLDLTSVPHFRFAVKKHGAPIIYDSGTSWKLTSIPKEAHFYWGSSSMPFLRAMTIVSFAKHNPDWSINLYIPSAVNNKGSNGYNIEASSLSIDDSIAEVISIPNCTIWKTDCLLEKSANMTEVQKSDLIRWALLSHVGGAWFDMDILFLNPIGSIYFNTAENSSTDTVVCFDHRHGGEMLYGALFSSVNNRFFLDLFSRCVLNDDLHNHFSLGARMIKNLGITASTINDLYRGLSIVSMNLDSFYLKSYKEMRTVHEQNCFHEYLNRQCIGIHWFGGLTMSAESIRRITKQNYDDFDDTLCKAISHTMRA